MAPTPGGLDLLAVTEPGVPPEALRRVQERLEAARALCGASAGAVRPAVLDPLGAPPAQEALDRLALGGALVAGRLAPATWDLLERARGPLTPLAAGTLAAAAPSPLAALTLSLLATIGAPGPLDAALALLRTRSAGELARADAFLLAWAELVPPAGGVLAEAMRLARSGETAERPAELPHLLEAAHGLAWMVANAIRSARAGGAAWAWRDRVGTSVPRLLAPALGASLARAARRGPLRLDPVRVGSAYEIRVEGGALLGRGATPVQARVRALALLAEAHAPDATPDLAAGLDPTWRAVAQALGRPRREPTLLLMPIAGGASRPGSPSDPLNRGPSRDLELDAALAVRIAPGRRPSGLLLPPDLAVQQVLRRAARGAALEIVPSTPSARPVSARLADVARTLRLGAASIPVAVEAGGRVFLRDGGRVRSYALRRFAARPRRFHPDPEAPDLSVGAGERRASPSAPAGFVQCRVTLAGVESAALLYVDASDVHLREELPLAEVEERLSEARRIVLASRPTATLAVRLSDGVEPALRRAGRRSGRVGVEVTGALPFVEVRVGLDRFGGGSGLGWSAAAEALLATSPVDGAVTVGVDAVTATVRGATPPPLLALHASSVARRRLRTHLLRAMSAYRAAAAGRRAG